MISVKLKEKENMNLVDILSYIQLNTPKEILNEKIDDTLDDSGVLLKRKYICENKKNEKHIFIFELDNEETFISYEIKYDKESDEVLDINDLL